MQLRGRRAGLILASALFGAAVLTMVVLARPAAATLVTATPTAGASLGAPPSAVSLTFTAPVAEAHVAISGAVADGEPEIDAATITQPVAITVGGHYVVAYHVVTMDGGEAMGTMSFDVSGLDRAALLEPPQLPDSVTGGHLHGELDAVTAAVLGANLLVVLAFAALSVRRWFRRRSASPIRPGA